MRWLLISVIFIGGCASLQQDRRCNIKPNPGPCKAAITKYYFDKKEQKCKPFTWGGCMGSVPFDDLEECQACITAGS